MSHSMCSYTFYDLSVNTLQHALSYDDSYLDFYCKEKCLQVYFNFIQL